VLDVVAKKAGGMKEQAFVVFRDVTTAATAMRSLQVLHRSMVKISAQSTTLCINFLFPSAASLIILLLSLSLSPYFRASSFLARPSK
jgi:hypothetical protein